MTPHPLAGLTPDKSTTARYEQSVSAEPPFFVLEDCVRAAYEAAVEARRRHWEYVRAANHVEAKKALARAHDWVRRAKLWRLELRND